MNVRAALQILFQGIILKPFKMLMAKHYLRKVGAEVGRPTLFRAGVGDGHTSMSFG
jgi:hypothetical protein